MFSFFGSLGGKILGGAIIAMVLSGGIFYAISGIKGCVRDHDNVQVLKETLQKTGEVQNEKAEIQRETEGLSDDELANSFHSAGGYRVRGKH